MDETPDQEAPPEGAKQPPPPPEPVPEHDTPNPEPRAEHHEPQKPNAPKPKRDDDALDRAMVRWTSVVGFFTIILAVVGGIQTWAFIQSERAAIYAQIDQIDPTPVVADQPIAIDVTIINNGRAQAFFSEARVGVWAGTSLPKKPDFSKATFTVSGVVPPQSRRYIRFGPVRQAFNWAQIDDINRGVAHLWVYGIVRFTDDFTWFGSKTIGFCVVYLPPHEVAVAKPVGPPAAECDNPNYDYQ